MDTSREGTRALVKLLAIIGFFALIALSVWLVVQGVRLFPSAFSSLASIAETVSTYRPDSELTIELEKNIVNSGETFTLTWTDMGEGTYTFKHVCADGISLAVRTSEGLLQEVSCTEALSLPGEVHGLFVSVNAREQRFSDVALTVTFDGETGDDHVAESRVTVVNATVPTKPVAIETTDDMEEPEVIVPPKKETDSRPTPPKSTTPTASVPSQPASAVVAVLPKSYENGFIDVRATYLGVGTMVNGSFVPKATFDKDDKAAFRFEVKNIGTKVSGNWTYKLTLPGDVEYTSDTQTGLMPNERAVYTVGFDLAETSASAVTVEGVVTVKNDTDTKNNDFDWSVKVVN
jgi:hypothetical protein